MKSAITALRVLVFMTLLTGITYPVFVTILGQVLFTDAANGSLIKENDKIIGSKLLAQKFESEKYFWPRPSAIDYNPQPSGGSNLGQASGDLKKAYDERLAKLKMANPDSGEPPQDLLFASASGVDPEISPEAARYQVSRVARARNMDTRQVTELVDKIVKGRQLGLLGEPRVNVLVLNRELDQIQSGVGDGK